MPTYQYACTECDHFFEQFQSFSDEALTVCPQCSGRLRKVFNAVGVVFKGSGFYRTDSRTSASSSTDGGASSSGGEGGSGESKSGSSSGDGAKSPSTSASTSTKTEKTSTPTPAA